MITTSESEVIKKFLGNKYLALVPISLRLEETIAGGPTDASATLQLSDGEKLQVSATGNGLLDALFAACCSQFSGKFKSLKTLELDSFKVVSRLETRKRQRGSDAKVEIEMGIKNAYGEIVFFNATNRSLVAAITMVVVEAIEFFINTELAYFTALDALNDAQKRGRHDLTEKYTALLANFVKYTNYSLEEV